MADAKDRFCRNCGRGHHRFRELDAEERAYVAAEKGAAAADRYRRCTNGTCVRVQDYFKAADGLSLPESFREPKGAG
ncbi:hypothetical protein ACIBL6_05225 [Streptomyces sp. NPDC050400]|uniref:hypothetical protein n=1 Tax=unclassified Streptomyces TaxID=2593676 RepID=UPI00355876D7